MTVLLLHGDREYLREPGEELQTDLGVLTVPEDVEPGDTVETHLGVAFTVRSLRGPDLFHHFERSGSPMVPRDVGLLIGKTGIASGDRILDVGTGTGVLAAYLGRIGADVLTYEHDSEAADIARENMKRAGVSDTVEVRNEDATSRLSELADEPPFDVITLDTGDASAIVEHTPDLLADGGYVGVYSPFVEHARLAEETATEVGLSVTTSETIHRSMDFDERGSRPQTTGVGHTGYLTIGRLDERPES